MEPPIALEGWEPYSSTQCSAISTLQSEVPAIDPPDDHEQAATHSETTTTVPDHPTQPPDHGSSGDIPQTTSLLAKCRMPFEGWVTNFFALAAFVVAVYGVYRVDQGWTLAKWTATGDHREACIDDKVGAIPHPSMHLLKYLTEPGPPAHICL